MFAITLFHVVLRPQDALDIALLSSTSPGTASPGRAHSSACSGGILIGFVAGWFVAFVRNLVIASRVLMIRGKADLAQSRDFLDHI